MPIILKNLNGLRRAEFITQAEADKAVTEGMAMQDKVHTAIYEEVTKGEQAQGYMTRSMQPLPVRRNYTRTPSKARDEEAEVPATKE